MSRGSTVEIASASWCHEERKILHGICMVRARYRVCPRVERKRPYMDRPEQFLVAIGFFAFYRFCIRARERTSRHHVLAQAPSHACTPYLRRAEKGALSVTSRPALLKRFSRAAPLFSLTPRPCRSSRSPRPQAPNKSNQRIDLATNYRSARLDTLNSW